MRFKRHSALSELHATLSPSQYHWIRYDDEKLERTIISNLQKQRGTEEHAYAQNAIALRILQVESPAALHRYINDSIRWRLNPEQTLFYSVHCFGHADACGYNERTRVFRVSDYKSGKNTASMDQLKIYCALFCLEYDYMPHDISQEMRIYQGKTPREELADPHEIMIIMDRIKTFSARIDEIREENL